MCRKNVLALVPALVIGSFAQAQAQAQPRFYDDDPLWVEEHVDVPEQPAAIKLSDLYDRLRHTFGDSGDSEGGEAMNVNTVDEVPDSAWFTNRHGRARMPIPELVRGPNRGDRDGPTAHLPWTVVEGKNQGLTPGFEVVDGEGERYLIKLDPADAPKLSSAAEVIATKLFHALGYNVPENYIVRFDPSSLRIAPGARVLDRFGSPTELTETRLQRMLDGVAREPGGKVRAVASKIVDGRPLGPFRYSGTRSDDPNDVVPHEDRRELRGLRLFAAWLNHDDARAQNTLDTFVRAEAGGSSFVRHHLIDFGSTFGSGTIDLQLPNLGFHYWLELDLMKKNALGLGFHVPAYRKVTWPRFPEYGSVGRWEAAHFDPAAWKTDYPNPAFVRMTPRDAFWAAKILVRFTPEELRAIVRTGELEKLEEETYFFDTLLERQRKSARFGLNGINPLDAFRVEAGRLTFTNLSERYGYAEVLSTYEITWSAYDEGAGRARYLTPPSRWAEASSPLPTRPSVSNVEVSSDGGVGPLTASILRDGELLLAEIYTDHPHHRRWRSRIGVYLRFRDNRYEVVGVERESHPALERGEK